jgi:hypothetical protein
LQEQDDDGDRKADDQCLSERNTQSVVIFGPVILSSDAGGAHAQEIHPEIKECEDGAANGYGTQVDRTLEVPRNTRIDHAEQRHRYVGENHGRSNAPHVTIVGQALVSQARIIRRR